MMQCRLPSYMNRGLTCLCSSVCVVVVGQLGAYTGARKEGQVVCQVRAMFVVQPRPGTTDEAARPLDDLGSGSVGSMAGGRVARQPGSQASSA